MLLRGGVVERPAESGVGAVAQ